MEIIKKAYHLFGTGYGILNGKTMIFYIRDLHAVTQSRIDDDCLYELKTGDSYRTFEEWVDTYGGCMDDIRFGEFTIPELVSNIKEILRNDDQFETIYYNLMSHGYYRYLRDKHGFILKFTTHSVYLNLLTDGAGLVWARCGNSYYAKLSELSGGMLDNLYVMVELPDDTYAYKEYRTLI